MSAQTWDFPQDEEQEIVYKNLQHQTETLRVNLLLYFMEILRSISFDKNYDPYSHWSLIFHHFLYIDIYSMGIFPLQIDPNLNYMLLVWHMACDFLFDIFFYMNVNIYHTIDRNTLRNSFIILRINLVHCSLWMTKYWW